jgi:chromosome partitioning protein
LTSASEGVANGKTSGTKATRRPTRSKASRQPSVPERSARIIAIANQKGGVGKSTTAVSLGAALAEIGKRVLVVDLDPQGNASTGMGIRHEAREVTVYDVLAAEAAIEGAIVATPVPNLFAIPSTIDLAGAEIELVSQFSRELRLRKALEPLKSGDAGYDFILLDCPPSLGLLTVNALAAAEELIVPIQCEYYALEGLGQLLRNVTLVQQNVNTALRLTGIVMTMFDPRTKLSEQVVDEVRRHFGDRVYDTIIPRTVRLSEAPGFGQPITVYDPRSRGAECYRDLAREVVEKLPQDTGLPIIDELPTVIVPPPEPEPARAPRPLVREPDADEAAPAAELDEPGLDVAVDLPSPFLDEAGGEPKDVAAEDGAMVQDESEWDDASGRGEPTRLAEPVPAAEVEHTAAAEDRDGVGAEFAEPVSPAEMKGGFAARSSADTAGDEPASEHVVDVEPRESSPPSVETEAVSSAPGPVAAPRLEVGRVIVIDEDESPAEPRPMPEPEGEPEEAAPRKRWSLFRRGGDR